ncbi:MAG TPA: hypothetical protein VNN10_13485 [Dehalococcoidia bacterium]|nr:hypothetical protein [Dehalococcoidia bacterium]
MFASGVGGGLTVDLLLSGYRLAGVSYQVTAKLRLSDLLNSRSETFLLRHASVLSLKGQVMASLPEVSVQKTQIIAAIPKESEDYKHQHQLYRVGMVKPTLVRVPVLALLPPYAATGKVHVPPNSDLSDPAHSGLLRFFPLTDTFLFLGEERLYQGPVVLLNRDMLAVLGQTGDEIQDPPGSRAEPEDRAILDDVLSALNQPFRR